MDEPLLVMIHFRTRESASEAAEWLSCPFTCGVPNEAGISVPRPWSMAVTVPETMVVAHRITTRAMERIRRAARLFDGEVDDRRAEQAAPTFHRLAAPLPWSIWERYFIEHPEAQQEDSPEARRWRRKHQRPASGRSTPSPEPEQVLFDLPEEQG